MRGVMPEGNGRFWLAEHQITFPMTGHRAVFDQGKPPFGAAIPVSVTFGLLPDQKRHTIKGSGCQVPCLTSVFSPNRPFFGHSLKWTH